MNRVQNNVIRMTNATLELLDDHSEIWGGYEVITNQKQKVISFRDEAKNHKEGQSDGNTQPQTKTKNELLASLSNRTGKVARKARGLARLTNDNPLLLAVDFSLNDIENGSDQETLDTVNKILSAAEGKEGILKKQYNLDPKELKELKEIAIRIDDIINDRTATNAGGKTSTANLSETISQLRTE